MILLDKFDYGSPAETVKHTEAKKVLKKPSGLKTQPVNSEEKSEVSESIDLDFGSDEEKPVKTAEKKISRGFDFLDED